MTKDENGNVDGYFCIDCGNCYKCEECGNCYYCSDCTDCSCQTNLQGDEDD